MASYVAYGLGIDSEIELPELPEIAIPTDIVIRRGRVERPADLADDSDDYVLVGHDTVIFHTPYAGFRITSGRELTVDAAPGVTPATLRLTILGRVLGAMLQWQGLFVLHASAVAHGGCATAFAGASGSGKSTTAAAFVSEGWDLVTDDIVAVELDREDSLIRVGYPDIKLWPDAAIILGHDPSKLDRIHENHEKRFVRLVANRGHRTTVPLDSIFVLASGDAPTRIEPLDSQSALVEVLRHSYAPRIMRVLGRQELHLDQCARLVRTIQPKRLVIDRSVCRPFDVTAAVTAASLDVDMG